MIRGRLKQLSGRTLNTTLSPDLSIAQGATYYAGMLLAHDKFARSILNEDATERLAQVKQQSVNARELGILVRDMETQTRVPHYLIPPNTPLPTSATQQFGTVVPNQKRVHLVIVESGTRPDQPYVVLGECKIDGLPPNLPEGSKIDVTISYDPQATVHVSAKDAASGKSAAHGDSAAGKYRRSIDVGPAGGQLGFGRAGGGESQSVQENGAGRDRGPRPRPGERSLGGVLRSDAVQAHSGVSRVRTSARRKGDMSHLRGGRPGEEQARSSGKVTRGQIPRRPNAEPSAARCTNCGREAGSQAADAGNGQTSVRPTAAQAAVSRAA